MPEIYDVLTELESLAAERAAEAELFRGGPEGAGADRSPTWTPRWPIGDLEAWAQADDRFHTELVRLGGNSRVVSIVAMMQDQVRRARAVTLFMRPLPTSPTTTIGGV